MPFETRATLLTDFSVEFFTTIANRSRPPNCPRYEVAQLSRPFFILFLFFDNFKTARRQLSVS